MIQRDVLIARLRSAGSRNVSMSLVEETMTADRERMTAFKKKWRRRWRVCSSSCCLILLGGFAALLALFATSPWTRLCADCGWPPRADFGATVLPDGRFVLAGGRDEVQNFADVWVGDQEGAWRRVMEVAPFRSRHGHSLLSSSGGTLVLFGGDEAGLNGVSSLLKNDVWRSVDAENWVLQTEAARWAPRKYFGAVTDGADGIYLAGGFDAYAGGSFNDVWSSQDLGRTWQPVLLAAPWSGRHAFGLVRVLDGLQAGSFYLMGGFDGLAHHDVWLGTSDASGWALQRFTHTRESRYDVFEERAPWTPRHGMAAAVVEGRVKVYGGRTEEEGAEGSLSREIWELPAPEAVPTDWWAKRTSDDRLNVRTTPRAWTAATTPPWTARSGHLAVVDSSSNGLFILGGEDMQGFKADMWKEAFSFDFVNFYSTMELAVLQVIDNLNL